MTEQEKDIKYFEERLARHRRHASNGVDNAMAIAYEEEVLHLLKGAQHECKSKRSRP
jgi:hypothetical protein